MSLILAHLCRHAGPAACPLLEVFLPRWVTSVPDRGTALAQVLAANLILAPKQEAQRIATYVPRWGVHLAAHLSESKAWEIYRERQRRFASLIGDREPIVLHKQIPGMGSAKRYIITIASDDRAPLDNLCQRLIAIGATCDVLRNARSQD